MTAGIGTKYDGKGLFCWWICMEGLMMMRIMITLKDTIPDFFFFTISSLCRELSPTRTLKWPERICVQITCNTSGAHHVQDVCLVVRRDISAVKFDRVEIAFILALFYWLKPLTDEWGGGNRSTRRKLLMTHFSKCDVLKPEQFKHLNLHSSIGDRLGRQTC